MIERTPEGQCSALGSWPGSDVVEAARTVMGELGTQGLPHLVELPARGPGADLVGRSAVLLVDTPVDLQPSGWRLVSRPGRDLERARALLRQDLDVLAEVAHTYRGPLKVQVCGPWTLAASLYLPRLERAVVDPGACRDVVGALAEGVALHVREVRRLLPDVEVVLQLDEPSVGAVLDGALPTASGFGRLRAVEAPLVEEGLRSILAAATGAGAAETLVHCCAPGAPVELFDRAGADGVSVDLALLDVPRWEALAALVEKGRRVWAGAVPTSGAVPAGAAVADAVWRPWRRLGLDGRSAADVVVTPACGLVGGTPAQARARLDAVRAGGAELRRRTLD